MGLKQIGGEIRAQPLNENFQYLDGKLLFGPESNRPYPGVAGRIFVTTDKRIIYEDTGTAWQKVGVVNWNDIDGKPTSFTPSAHASSHAAGGSDPITPVSIGAVNRTGDTMTGQLQIDGAWLRVNDPTGGNSHIDLRSGNIRRVLIYWDNANQQLKFRKYDTDGNNVLGELRLDTNAVYLGSSQIWHAGNAGPFYRGAGSPEGVVTAPPGSIYQNTNGGQGTTVYYKASGTGNTGWRAIA